MLFIIEYGTIHFTNLGVAQLVACYHGVVEVVGSSPVTQTMYMKQFRCPRNFSEGIVLLGEFVFSGNLSRQYRDIIEIKYR